MSVRASLRSWRDPALVAAAALLVYANSLANGFAYDDVRVVHDDPRLHSLAGLARIWREPYWSHYGEQLGLFRPLTSTLFTFQWLLSGGAPWFFHLVNVLGHIAVTICVLLLLRRFVSARAALVGALVFAVHPVHTEAVSNVVGQAEIWAALGTVLAVLVYTGRSAAGTTPLRRWAVAGAYAFALFAKESAILLPALLVVTDVIQRRWAEESDGWRGYVRAAVPAFAVLAVVAGGYLLLRVAVLGRITGSDVGPDFPFLAHDHFRMGLRVWPEYIRLLFFPQDLSADYSPGVILPVTGVTPMLVAGALILLAVTALALLTPRLPAVGFPAAWCLITIFVVSNLVFPIGVFLAERTLYLPSVAVALVVAYAWEPLLHGLRRPALAWGAAAVVLVLMGVRTFVRNPDWKDSGTIIVAMYRDHPESYRAQWNAAGIAAERRNQPAALAHWELGLRLWSQNAQFLTEMGQYMLETGKPRRAEQLLRQAESIRPGFARTESLLGAALVENGHPAEALAYADSATRRLGPDATLFEVKARAFFALGRYDQSVGAWRARLRRRPTPGRLHWYRYALALRAAGDTAAARVIFDGLRSDSAATAPTAGPGKLP